MVAGGLIDQGLVLEWFGVQHLLQRVDRDTPHAARRRLVGSINGFVITRFNVAPFIATLGMLYVARGAALLRSSGATFPNLVGKPELGNTGYPELGSGIVLGPPHPDLADDYLRCGIRLRCVQNAIRAPGVRHRR